ncbi:hypothetical protein BDF22DRAFT_677964 [Syncephalis plumigaleata]|nr:hypothetical protein BDF22DRAFT_677964 [Syncephalis plumigaleata]
MSTTEPMDTPDVVMATESEPVIFEFDILSFVYEARNTYGLRHEDYQRYRQYCARKLQRLRKSLSFVQTKGRKFHKRPVEEDVLTDVRFLEVALVDCERAWSTAMELKVYARDEPRKQYHMIRRLRKAAKLAHEFAVLCDAKTGRVDVRTSLDAKAYAAWLDGILHIELRAWQTALNQLTMAGVIYDKMAQTGTAYQENLCQAMVDQIDPNIRLCIYHLRMKEGDREVKARHAAAASRLPELNQLQARKSDDATTTTTTTSTSDVKDTIEWRGHTIPITNEELYAAMNYVREMEDQLDTSHISTTTKEDVTTIIMDAYSSVLTAYTRLERIARRLVKEDKTSSAKIRSSKSEQRSLALRRIYDFAIYHRLQHTIQRQNTLMAANAHRLRLQQSSVAAKLLGKKIKWSQIIKQQSRIVDYVHIILRLPSVKDDIALSQEVEAAIQFYRAILCQYTIEAYAQEQRFREAFALIDRVRDYLRQASSNKGETTHDDTLFSATALHEAEQSIQALQLRLHAAWTRHEDHVNSNISDKMASLSVQDESATTASSSSSTAITNKKPTITGPTFPPAIQPIAVKPVFFDLALNFIDYDTDTIATKGGKKGQGLSGLLGGLWGRK